MREARSKYEHVQATNRRRVDRCLGLPLGGDAWVCDWRGRTLPLEARGLARLFRPGRLSIRRLRARTRGCARKRKGQLQQSKRAVRVPTIVGVLTSMRARMSRTRTHKRSFLILRSRLKIDSAWSV